MSLSSANDVPGTIGWYFGLITHSPAGWSVTVWEHRPGIRSFDVEAPDRAGLVAAAQEEIRRLEQGA